MNVVELAESVVFVGKVGTAAIRALALVTVQKWYTLVWLFKKATQVIFNASSTGRLPTTILTVKKRFGTIFYMAQAAAQPMCFEFFYEKVYFYNQFQAHSISTRVITPTIVLLSSKSAWCAYAFSASKSTSFKSRSKLYMKLYMTSALECSEFIDLVQATSICHFDGRSRLIGPGSDSDSRILSDMVNQNPLWLPSTRSSEKWLDYQTKYQASSNEHHIVTKRCSRQHI